MRGLLSAALLLSLCAFVQGASYGEVGSAKPMSSLVSTFLVSFEQDMFFDSTDTNENVVSPARFRQVLEARGGGLLPAGYNPFGYKITELGERFLGIHQNCLECDVGRFLASLKSKRKTLKTLQGEWLEIVRVSKSGQTMRIYRTLSEMVDFCLQACLID